MPNRTITITDANGECIAVIPFHHDCFPELSEEIPLHRVGTAIRDGCHHAPLEVGKTYSFTVTATD